MALTSFVDGTTKIVASWLNQIDVFVNTLFNGATTAAQARTALGSTSVGDAVYTAASASAARSTLGATSTGDAVFVATNAAAARTAIGALGNTAGAVSYSNIQNETAYTLLGNSGGSAAAPAEVTMDYISLRMSGTQMRPVFAGKRQTIIFGPVDSNGLASFGGTIAGTAFSLGGSDYLIASAASGCDGFGEVDYIAQSLTGSACSWTGLNTNGTAYLYLECPAASTQAYATTGFTMSAPVYQWGGTPSSTLGVHTFNIQEMKMYVGTGGGYTQVRRVFVGHITVSGGVPTGSATWYQLNGRYRSAWTATFPTSAIPISYNHNLGVADATLAVELENTTAEQNYAVGDRVTTNMTNANTMGVTLWSTSTTGGFTTSASNVPGIYNKTTGVPAALTLADWKYRFLAERAW